MGGLGGRGVGQLPRASVYAVDSGPARGNRGVVVLPNLAETGVPSGKEYTDDREDVGGGT